MNNRGEYTVVCNLKIFIGVKMMKRFLIICSLIIFVFGCGSSAKSFRSDPPNAEPIPNSKIGEYQSFLLDNGLRVFVVEDHKLPKVSMQLFVDYFPVLEKDAAGLQAITGSLIKAGTEKRSKDDIDREIDFIGASFNTNSRGFYASALSKHVDKLFELSSDVLLNPIFPQDELLKLKKQMISELEAEKEDPEAISSKVGRALCFGKDHPYGEIITEKSVKNITREKCAGFYSDHFNPHSSYLIIVGDITKEEAIPLAQKYFGGWKDFTLSEEMPKKTNSPLGIQISFVEKKESVQSVITVIYPVDLKPWDKDLIKTRVMNFILGGGGFSSRLFKNLREDKGYTYSIGSNLIEDRFVGNFIVEASVRNSVTSDAILQILSEMKNIKLKNIPSKELVNIINQMTGNFTLMLEDPKVVGRFALTIARFNLPKDYYSTYVEKLNKITAKDIKDAAQKYLNPDDTHILVVGDESVVDELCKIDSDGKIDVLRSADYGL